MTADKFLEIAAQCWCDPRVSDRVMDAEMAQVFADALRQAYDQGLEDAIKVVDDELGNESDNDDERGHLRSMHIGAMDALRTVMESLKALKTPMEHRR